MIFTTTNAIQNKEITEYFGVVSGQAIVGANVFKDIFASFRDFFGGRSRSYERTIADAREMALKDLEEKAKEMRADAVVGIDIDYEVLGKGNSMLMVSANGTAVKFR